jgi:selenocysteine lyase/cysteine desulfurase
MLWVSPELREHISVPRRGYANLSNPNEGLHAQLHEDARRFDTLSQSAETAACALTAISMLESAAWSAVHEQARSLAARLAGMLAAAGREPAPRGASTLVSFHSPDPEGERTLLAEHGVIVRNIPGRPWLRASVGAWNNEHDLERLLQALPR